ncbi:DMT family transporter [Desulforhopalus sp. IMCC35007]|uniref:DMT family transporter n=1 Tax=Desulforhopalus sp. IMCC35007 TaxID=2569543 RepID=UPI0010AE1A95|nr:DMT family transporter [Desulforhopalus sp. IMCC35007]TKB08626.1 DMT family transporter [Desulforhopalus sp. IMCC35007]
MLIRTYFSLVLTMLLWGGTFIAGRVLAGHVTPVDSAFIRFFIASAALIPVVILTEKKLSIPPLKCWLPLLLLGLTGIFAYNVCFFFGLQHITAGRAALIIASTPLAITIFAAVFLKERLTSYKMAGVFLCLSGAILVISNGHPQRLLTGGFGPGEKALLGCVASWTTYSLVGRQVLKTMSPLTSVCYSSIIGTILLAIPAVQQGHIFDIVDISRTSWLSLAFLGIGGTALGFSLYYRAIQKIGAARTGIFINLVPVFSVLLSWLILGEAIKPIVIAGGLLILTGVSLTNFKAKKLRA